MLKKNEKIKKNHTECIKIQCLTLGIFQYYFRLVNY